MTTSTDLTAPSAVHGVPVDPGCPAHVAGAFDAISGIYDDHVPNTAWMRGELRRHFLTVFGPGDRILDVGCGTGSEAMFLAGHGMRITAVDLSPGMVSEAKRKSVSLGLEDRVDARVADLRELNDWPAERFGGIISTFASLNMVSSLAGFSVSAARLLKPGGRMVLHLSNRFCLHEFLRLAARGHWAEARRLTRDGVRSFTMAGRPMEIYLSSPWQTYAWFFEPDFELTAMYGLGIVRPHADPPYIPAAALRALGRIERPIRSRPPFAGWGRFFVLELSKRD